MELKDLLQQHKKAFEELPGEVRQLLMLKSKAKPYQRSVLKFRQAMISTEMSPLQKLFSFLQLKSVIEEEIEEYWENILQDKSRIYLAADDMTALMVFLIVKAEIPDLSSQLKLISEFTSSEIQNGRD